MIGMHIRGNGVISLGRDAPFAAETAALDTLPIKDVVTPRVSRRYGRLTKLLTLAVHRALADAGIDDPTGIPLVTATCIGESKAALDILAQIHETDGVRVSPALVPNSVHNAAAGYILINTQNHAPALTVSEGWLSSEAALTAAQDLLDAGLTDRVLLAAGDEADPGWTTRLAEHGAAHLAQALENQAFQEGATAWVLENARQNDDVVLRAAVERVPPTPDGIAALLDRHGIPVTAETEIRLRLNAGGVALRPIAAAAFHRDIDTLVVDGVGPGTVQSAPLLSVADHLRKNTSNALLLLAAEAEEIGVVWLGRRNH